MSEPTAAACDTTDQHLQSTPAPLQTLKIPFITHDNVTLFTIPEERIIQLLFSTVKHLRNPTINARVNQYHRAILNFIPTDTASYQTSLISLQDISVYCDKPTLLSNYPISLPGNNLRVEYSLTLHVPKVQPQSYIIDYMYTNQHNLRPQIELIWITKA
jgi:hypothetical protein